MASTLNGYSLSWDDYANSFSISLRDMLQREELVDVTLVADGHLFGAHRLVLSALSPYFRQIFTQMPVNQQAFVFLKDVPKETLESLINYIYCGNVNVEQGNVDGFFKTAKALGIKGLGDGNFEHTFDIQPSTFISIAPEYKRLQYQSTRTTPILDQVQPNYDERPIYSFYQNQDNFEGRNTDETHENGNHYDCNGYDDAIYRSEIGVGVSLDPNHGAQADQWNTNHPYGSEEEILFEPTETNGMKPAKRVKLNNDTSEYNMIPDIRPNGKGGENLFHNEHKFLKSYKPNKFDQQRWECTRKKSQKCSAAAYTMQVDGVIMMKISVDEHSHQE